MSVLESCREVVRVTDEKLLVSMVQTWGAELFPDDPQVGRRAAALALSAYMGGASLSEACREARVFLAGRARHPAGRGGVPTRPLSKIA
jgi:hypothetical protein